MQKINTRSRRALRRCFALSPLSSRSGLFCDRSPPHTCTDQNFDSSPLEKKGSVARLRHRQIVERVLFFNSGIKTHFVRVNIGPCNGPVVLPISSIWLLSCCTQHLTQPRVCSRLPSSLFFLPHQSHYTSITSITSMNPSLLTISNSYIHVQQHTKLFIWIFQTTTAQPPTADPLHLKTQPHGPSLLSSHFAYCYEFAIPQRPLRRWQVLPHTRLFHGLPRLGTNPN